ncbi:MAG: GFA family protein [Parvularculaceae bacterium]|nr:GFA family protein [Parvularculaceae bacterium]
MTQSAGQCLCGAVTFTATFAGGDVGVCHCGMCRRWAAGPFFGVTADRLDMVKDAALGVFVSSDWAERGFCKACGSPLFWRMRDKSMTVVSVNALDAAGPCKLDHEVFIDEKPAYYSFKEGAHQMTGAQLMAMFAPGKD